MLHQNKCANAVLIGGSSEGVSSCTDFGCLCGESGVGGIDKYNTSVFLEKILRYYYIPTTGVADLQAPLNNMLQSKTF